MLRVGKLRRVIVFAASIEVSVCFGIDLRELAESLDLGGVDRNCFGLEGKVHGSDSGGEEEGGAHLMCESR